MINTPDVAGSFRSVFFSDRWAEPFDMKRKLQSLKLALFPVA